MSVKKKKILISTSIVLANLAICSIIGSSIYLGIKNDKANKIDKIKDYKSNLNNDNDYKIAKNIININEKIHYFAMGDSISAGFTGMLDKDYPGSFDEVTKKFSGASFPTYLAKLLYEFDKERFGSYKNISLSGARLSDIINLFNWKHNPLHNIELKSQKNFGATEEEKEKYRQDIIKAIKKSNLMTLSYGANDIFEVLGTIFSKPKYNTILSDIQDSKKRNAALIKIVSVLKEAVDEINNRYTTVIQNIKKINPNTNIALNTYPMPLNRLTRVIDSLVLGLKGLSNSIIDILNNQIIKASAIANNVSFLNSYDKKYWTENQSKLTQVITDIHPTILGYKKMAMDAFIKLTTGYKSFDKYKKLDLYWNNDFVNKDESERIIDTLLSTNEILRRAFKNKKYIDYLYDLENDEIFKNVEKDSLNKPLYGEHNIGKRIVGEMLNWILDGIFNNVEKANADSIINNFVDINVFKKIISGKTNNKPNKDIIKEFFKETKFFEKIIDELHRFFIHEDYDNDGRPGGTYIEKGIFFDRLFLTLFNKKILWKNLINPFRKSSLYKDNIELWRQFLKSIFDKLSDNSTLDNFIDLYFEYVYDENNNSFEKRNDAKKFFNALFKNKNLHNLIYELIKNIVSSNDSSIDYNSIESLNELLKFDKSILTKIKPLMEQLIFDLLTNENMEEFRTHLAEKIINIKTKFKSNFKDVHNLIDINKVNIEKTRRIINEAISILSKKDNAFNNLIKLLTQKVFTTFDANKFFIEKIFTSKDFDWLSEIFSDTEIDKLKSIR